MADPVTILSIISGATGLGIKIGKVVHQLYQIREKIKNAELTILSIVTECETVQAAWSGIEKWAQKQETSDAHDQRLLDRLGQSLMVGSMVMSAFEDDLLLLYEKVGGGFWHRARLAWKESTFEKHQIAIRGQVAATTLLLQVINISSNHDRMELLDSKSVILKESDESAWTTIGSKLSTRASTSVEETEGRASLDSIDLTRPPLAFENDLFATRVYKRSYRFLLLRKTKRDPKSTDHQPLTAVNQFQFQTLAFGDDPKSPGSPGSNDKIFDFDNLSQKSSYIEDEFEPRVLSSDLRIIRGSSTAKLAPHRNLKVVLLGDGYTGKTALAIRFCFGFYAETTSAYDPTIEDSYCKYVNIGNQSILLEVIDLAGQDEYADHHGQMIDEADAFILCYSVTSRASIQQIPELYGQLVRVKLNQLERCPIMLVATKTDKESEREVSKLEGQSLAKILKCDFHESSAQENINVDRVFKDLAQRWLVLRNDISGVTQNFSRKIDVKVG